MSQPRPDQTSSPLETFVRLNTSRPTLGWVVSLGPDGLAMDYLAEEVPSPGEVESLDLWSRCLAPLTLPCRRLSDEIVHASQPPIFGPPVRRCRLALGPLAPEQSRRWQEVLRSWRGQAAEAADAEA